MRATKEEMIATPLAFTKTRNIPSELFSLLIRKYKNDIANMTPVITRIIFVDLILNGIFIVSPLGGIK